MADGKTPELVKAPTTELEGVAPEEREVMVPYAPKKGWVEDPQGRHHEVEDVERFLLAYPGSTKLKSTEVVKAKVGYADAPTEAEVAAEAPATGEGSKPST